MEWVDIAQKLGFPIFVAAWFMFRLEKKLERMMELQMSQMQSTAILAKTIERLDDERQLAGKESP